MQLWGRRYDTGQPVCLEIEGQRVVRSTSIAAAALRGEDLNGWPWIAPGFIDLQINGYGGQEFSAPS